VLNLGTKPASLRFSRRLEAFSINIKQPTVKRAAQTSVFEPTEVQIRAAMRTSTIDQPIAALLVTKQDEVLTEKLDRFDGCSAGSSSSSAAGCQ
jgi:hypothetical protein